MADKEKKEVFARMAFTDKIISLEDAKNNDLEITQDDSYLVGYEFEDGTECTEDGVEL